MTELELKEIFAKHPKFREYLTEEKRQAFMDNDDGFTASLEVWEEESKTALTKARNELNDILDSPLMAQLSRFEPRLKDRWEGMRSIIDELLGDC